MADVQRAGGIRRYKLDVRHLSRTTLAAAPVLSSGEHFRETRGEVGGIEANIDKARAGDRDVAHAGCFAIERFYELVRHIARLHGERLGQGHREVGGPVAVRGIARALKHDLYISGRTEGDGGLRECVAQCFEAAHCEPLELEPEDGPLFLAALLDESDFEDSLLDDSLLDDSLFAGADGAADEPVEAFAGAALDVAGTLAVLGAPAESPLAFLAAAAGFCWSFFPSLP